MSQSQPSGGSAEAKRIAVITMGTKLADETKGYTRIPTIARMLAQAGYRVDLITSSFQHWEKAHRDTASSAYAHGTEPFDIVFIDEPGYKRNIDPRRLRSHAVAAKNLTAYLESQVAAGDPYQLIYLEMPPNDVAAAAGRFAKQQEIPFVGDINDLWPEAMRMVLDVPAISSLLFAPLARDAREAYSLMDAVVGTSDEYATRPLSDNPDAPHITVYVGNELAQYDAGAAAHRDEVATRKGEGEFWVTYAGTLGTSYDIATLIQAADLLAQSGDERDARIRVKILGGGPEEDSLRELAAGLSGNVEFLGYQPYDAMAAWLCQSDVTVNSFVKKAPQSIVTKIGDYLAAGKPMINTCSSPEFRDKVTHDGFGVNIEAENPVILAAAIKELAEDPEACARMGARARTIAEEQFDRPAAYQRIVQLVDGLLGA